MSLRASLATLDDDALEALSNRGLLRRAAKDVAAGAVGTVTETAEGGLQATVEGVTVMVPAAGLAKASCECRAPGICRHRLAVALACRQAAQAPAGGSDARPGVAAEVATANLAAELAALDGPTLVRTAGRGTVRAALALLEESEAPEIAAEPGGLVIRWKHGAEVRYRSGLGFAGMISRAAGHRRDALHVAAVLACRHHFGMAEPPPELVRQAPPAEGADDESFLDDINAILADLLCSGLAHVTVAASERVADLAVSARGDDFPRLARHLRGLAGGLRGHAERRFGSRVEDLLAGIATLGALVHALRRARGAARAALKGRHRDAYREVDRLDLVPVAGHRWCTAGGAEGIRVHYWSPAEDRWHSLSVLRPDGADPSWSGPAFAVLGPWLGARFRDDAGARRLRLTGARRSEDGKLSVSARIQAHPLDGPWMAEGERFGAQDFDRWSALRRWAAGRIPLGLHADWSDAVAVLRPATTTLGGFDPASQRLHMTVTDGDGADLVLTVLYRSGARERVAGWAQLLNERQPAALVCLAPAAPASGLALDPIAALWPRPEGGWAVAHIDFPTTPAEPTAEPAAEAVDAVRTDEAPVLPPWWLAEMLDLVTTLAGRGTAMPSGDHLARALARSCETARAIGLDWVAGELSRLRARPEPSALMQTTYDLLLLRRAHLKTHIEASDHRL
ncbi:MAG: hypothetical protein GC191_04675 [Azospirillum sp.]|nr:hypothetical protein [Azospirillum sp.]